VTSQYKHIRQQIAQALFEASLAVRNINNPCDLDAALVIVKNALTSAREELFPKEAEIIEAEIIIEPKEIDYECSNSCGKTCPSAIERERTS
jgi:hypothetical protein